MKSTHITASIIAILLLLWLASGQLQGEQESENPKPAATKKQKEIAPPRVRARLIAAEPYRVEVMVRGRTEAKRIVNVRAETSGRVVALPIEKGSVVKAGDLLCRLALDDRAIRLEEAKAAVTQAKIEYDGAQKLAKDGYQSETNIAAAQARLTSAKAALKRNELELQNIEIRSPFDGVVEDRPVNIGDLVERSGICAKVLDPDPMLVTGYVSEQEIAQLKLGETAGATLITGEAVSGVISFISHAAESATRTYRVELEVPNPDHLLRDGITAEIKIPTITLLAHRVSPALLTLDDHGEIGVRVLDEDNTVHFVKVNIVGDTQSGVWIQGLPDTVRLITVGQELVFEGQKADVEMETETL